MGYKDILEKLPYSAPFLFVDELLHVDDNGAEGCFTFKKDSCFYRGHFKNNPVTPGVLLIEAMAQAGLVCLGIYLLKEQLNNIQLISLTSAEVEFIKPVYPGEKVRVVSEKMYFRFGKLKCRVTMFNALDEEVCKGNIAGVMIKK